MDFIEKVIYINLSHRIDRKQQIESELLKVFPPEKIQRFDAIKHEKGGIGCSMSHIGALELAIQNNWKNVLIVEDDLQWRNPEKGSKLLLNLISKPYDVILLSGHDVFHNSKTYKLRDCCARTAYLVSNHYYTTLLNNYKEGLKLLIKEFKSPHRGDRYWNRIQQRDNWYIIMPQMCIQRPSFSDIEQRNVNYTHRCNNRLFSMIKSVRFP
uniref:Glycosyltransferase n=1 Tax=viral metagenome TaxID=1070528 RepID=A0A6C0ENS4_9ZZZZ